MFAAFRYLIFSLDGFVESRTDSREITAYYAMVISKPQFANGTAIPNGRYCILIRALKITGNAQDNDYESC